MHALLEFAPLVAFLAAYYLGGFYVATAVLMVAMLLLLAVDWLRERRIPPMHGISAVLVLAFGAATLLLRDQRFIQWKPTVFFWLISVAFLLSFWVGRQVLVQRLLGPAMSEMQVSPATWRRLNALWIVFYAALGALNLVVAFNASESTWVQFKVFGLTFLTLVFVVAQFAWVSRRSAVAVKEERLEEAPHEGAGRHASE